MKIQIKSRWSSRIVFECDIDAGDDTPIGVRIGMAVRVAIKSRADLSRADLSGAVLSRADLSGADLRGAVLSRADLSGAVLSRAVLSGADLRGAVLRGADLSRAVLRGADLRGAVLRGADLSRAVLSDAVLSDAVLRGAVLSGADLSGADLRGADLSDAVLSDAVLSDAVLRGADLRGADLSRADWIPRIENIHQKVFAAASADGALNMGSWHQDGYCGTTHCRAGWVCVLAGEGGRVLEGVMGTSAAAALIYQASDPTLGKIPDWHLGNTEALEDMRRLAESESAA